MTTGPVLRITEQPCGGDALRLRLAGELDLATGEHLRAVARKPRTVGCARLELDLREVTFVDISGARALGEVVQSLEAAGGRVRVLPGRALVRVVHLSGLDRELQLL